jgi:ring-1,2-phenylacetyl-CoA epoxidase subunit PaaD
MVTEVLAEPVHGRPGSSAGPMEEQVWHLLQSVADPEIPVLSVVDLGIVRYVRTEGRRLHVGITPTYSGCPATEVIRQAIRETLDRADLGDVSVDTVLSPPWTSEWLSEEGRRKLRAFGIDPPAERPGRRATCPRCGSHDVECISEFGSTPCKAHYRCGECLEPFDVFKCI